MTKTFILLFVCVAAALAQPIGFGCKSRRAIHAGIQNRSKRQHVLHLRYQAIHLRPAGGTPIACRLGNRTGRFVYEAQLLFGRGTRRVP